MTGEFRIIHVAFLGFAGFQDCEIAELLLTRCVIHHADDADIVAGSECCQFFRRGLRPDLGPEVREVADLEEPGFPRSEQLIRKRARMADGALLAAVDGANADAVNDRCDPGRCQFCVMGDKRLQARSVYIGAPPDMAREAIRLHFGQARDDQILDAIHQADAHVIALGILSDHDSLDGNGTDHTLIW